MSRFNKSHVTFYQKLISSAKLKREFKKDYQNLNIAQLQRKYRIQYRQVYMAIDKLGLKPRRNINSNRKSGIWKSVNDVSPDYTVLDFGIIVKYSEKYL